MTIRKLMRKRSFTQSDLARLCSITPAMVSYLVNAKRKPGPNLRAKIARVLKVEPSAIS
jgi:transcriptional regulator with XRE-family HTH domain